ncbi:MAG: extracellular solute-binding protein [Anaerolineae bacterium]|nr:extracellular solute-binding protein [Anaerolineae bacterium]
MRRLTALFLLSSLLVMLNIAVVPATAQNRQVVNVYSTRHYGPTEAPFSAFTEATGIEVRVSQGSNQALLDRLRAEGDRTVADVFMTVDAGTLGIAADEGLLQPIVSDVLTENIPAEFRDADMRWVGLSSRVRGIVYNPEVVDVSELSTYEALGDPKWQGRLCLRPGSHIYTISLTSSLIYHFGETEAEAIVASWVANNPTYIDSDTRIIESVLAGQCDLGVTNHYYLARLLNENADYPIKFFFPNQGEEERGAFYNLSGAGITTAALNYDNAVLFLEFLSTLDIQNPGENSFPTTNFEYPVHLESEVHPILEGFGEFKLDLTYPATEYKDFQQPALDLLERVGYGMSE